MSCTSTRSRSVLALGLRLARHGSPLPHSAVTGRPQDPQLRLCSRSRRTRPVHGPGSGRWSERGYPHFERTRLILYPMVQRHREPSAGSTEPMTVSPVSLTIAASRNADHAAHAPRSGSRCRSLMEVKRWRVSVQAAASRVRCRESSAAELGARWCEHSWSRTSSASCRSS